MTSHDAPRSTSATGSSLAAPENGIALGERAVRTREAIIDASRRLFLERGYAGTRINNITDACGISRAGFYTYFRDKREVFNTIGEETYKEIVAVVSLWSDMPSPASLGDVTSWVRQYFSFMDQHGAFIFSSTQSAPTDDEFRRNSQRTQMRVAWLLGTNLVARQQRRYEAPEALGLTMMAMLDQSYFYSRVWRLPVDDDDMIRTLGEQIHDSLANGR
ncbi:TetR/AcrR family transcriptional regulator [Williamsia sp. DF01-3]|uniref:TetR/AcrR family transcriptional regulator n=1 Tax=Williamsia sp. DF01-3 TaxID=2934157 RepID=UPI001FF5BE91|nr:TetR/AcrR family transcriptional regulator [Williamsia sp. DF01-3]MCK0516742.1 TetR/AcrR family transcriptional regulator [Williamsia sp. DF01-3]